MSIIKVSLSTYTNKHLDSFSAAVHCKYESAEPQKHIQQSSKNSAWDLFNILWARNMARELMTDPNNKTTVWEGVSRVSGASHTSQSSRPLRLPCWSCDLLYPKWNAINKELNFSSIHHCIWNPTSSTPPSSHTSHHNIGSSFGVTLLFIYRLYKVAHEPIAWTACLISKNDAQPTTRMTLRSFPSHAEWCSTPPGASDPDRSNQSIVSVRGHKLLGNSDTGGMAKNI
jgi:hypothetical protein